MRKIINYQGYVGGLLTGIVRVGGTIVYDAGGLKVRGVPARGAYETVYTVSSTISGSNARHLVREDKDEYGRVLKREVLTAQGEWMDATEG